MTFNGRSVQIIISVCLLVAGIEADDCADKISNCRSYGTSLCSNQQYLDWAKLNCAYTCAFCSGPPPSKECVDNRNDCDKYVANICTASSWKVWAEDNCSKFCGFCSASTTTTTVQTTASTSTTSVTTASPTATTQKVTTPCADGLNFCLVYSKSACSDATWADTYCKKTCSRC